MRRRIVITGIGVVTSIGAGREEFWRNLLAGACGIGPVTSFDTSRYSVHRGAEVLHFDAAPYVRNLDPDRLGRASRLAIAAGRMALEDSAQPESLRTALDGVDPARVGVAVGTTSGEAQEIEKLDDIYVSGGLEHLNPDFIDRYPCHLIGEYVAAEIGAAGPNLTLPCACAAGNYAIAHAAQSICAGHADLMLAGGAEAFSRITFTGFARLGAIAPNYCQPFDRQRKGMIPGEGAGILILEPLERALTRGARIYAELTGCGLSCDAYHMTAAHPEGDGAARAMASALRQSGRSAQEVDYISAHGTGTPTNDRLETVAIKRVFQQHAYKVPISSVKSMLGHTMGAASALESAVCALAIQDGRIPPTIHLDEPDTVCDLDYVPNRAREHEVRVAMNNAYAFGGNNSSLILERYSD